MKVLEFPEFAVFVPLYLYLLINIISGKDDGVFLWQKSWAPRPISEAACHDRALLGKPAQLKAVKPCRKNKQTNKKKGHGYSKNAFSSLRVWLRFSGINFLSHHVLQCLRVITTPFLEDLCTWLVSQHSVPQWQELKKKKKPTKKCWQ